MSVVLIYGENEFTASEFYQAALGKFEKEHSEQSIRVFDGENTSATDIQEALSAQSLFSSGQEMVAIKRLGVNTELKDKLVELIATIPEETQLLIYEPKIDKRSKLYKLLHKTQSAKEFKNLTETELMKWVNDLVASGGGQLEAGSARTLIERTRGNQIRLTNEIAKLLNYDKTISTSSIRLLVNERPDDNIFDLLNYVAQSNKTKALHKYDELRSAQVEAHYILVMICWQVANFIAVKAGDKRSDKVIASDLGINPYPLKRTRQTLRNFTRSQLKELAKKVIAADIKLKTTSVDGDQLIKQLIIGL